MSNLSSVVIYGRKRMPMDLEANHPIEGCGTGHELAS
jgi:hypothetical protein